MRHAGIFIPNDDCTKFLEALPTLSGTCFTGLATELRFHYNAIRDARPDATVVWRAVPRHDRKPAMTDWKPGALADEAINLWHEQKHPYDTEYLQIANELNLSYERGEEGWDGIHPPEQYAFWSQYLSMASGVVRNRLKIGDRLKLHFPGWAPGHGHREAIEAWKPDAKQFDVVDIHWYADSSDLNLEEEHAWYRDHFPGKLLYFDEWNHRRGGEDGIADVLRRFEKICARDPLVLGASYFIWRWKPGSPGWTPDFDIEGNDARLKLFQGASPVEPKEPMTRDEIIALIVQKANDNGLVPYEFLGGAIAESGLDPNAERWGVWPDVSFGLYQQTAAFADEGDHANTHENVDLIKRLYEDPVHACDVAATKFKYWRYNPEVPALTAWCAYNWPGSYHTPEQNPNIGNYRDGLAKARQILGTEESHPDRLYGPDVPDSVVRQQNSWSCAVRSTYAALWSMAHQGEGKSVTYGDGGPNDVYDWMVPSIDDASAGLHRADGAELVAMLKSHGYQADRKYPASLADAQERAGKQPLLLGGIAWNHWVYCRGLEPDGTLILENPSPGFAGISDELRDSWARLGPMTIVWIDPPVIPKENDVTREEADRLTSRIAELETEREHLIVGMAVMSDNHGDTIQRALDEIKKIRTDVVGPRPTA